MAMIDEILAKLVALGLGSTTSNPPTIFKDHMPDYPDECCCVYPTGGAAPEGGFGLAGIHLDRPGIQVVFRGPRPPAAGAAVSTVVSAPTARAQAAYAGLAAVEAPTTLTGGGTSAVYHWIHPQQTPFELKRDENKRAYIAFNALIEKERSA